MFKGKAKKIKRLLEANGISLQHTGSSFIAGLAAKPVMDIMTTAKDANMTDAVFAEFKTGSYEYIREFGIPGRRYLHKEGDEHTHQIHTFACTDKNIAPALLFLRISAYPQKCKERIRKVKNQTCRNVS